MKVTVERNDLLAALGRSKDVIERQVSTPILGNVLIRVGGNMIGLTSTDMDTMIYERIPLEPPIVARGGNITAPARTLYDIVKETPKGAQIKLETVTNGDGEERLAVRAGRSSFALPCLPADDFPELTAVKPACQFTMPAGELARLITPICYAMSSEESRYYLNGAYFHAPDHSLRAVATDGHRLAMVKIPVVNSTGAMPGVILPRKAVHVLHKLVAKTDSDVKIAVSEARTTFALNGITLTTRNVDGSYPDYQRIIPTENGIVMSADRKQLAGVVKRVAKAGGSYAGVKCKLAPNSLTVSTSSPEGGEASEEVEVVYRGEPFEIGFNARYLADTLGAMDGAEVEFAMADAAGPAVVRDPADDSALHVLMPMRV